MLDICQLLYFTPHWNIAAPPPSNIYLPGSVFSAGWIKIIIYLNSIQPSRLAAHPHGAGGGSSSFYSHCVSHLKISTLFAHQQSQRPFRQILNQIKIVDSS